MFVRAQISVYRSKNLPLRGRGTAAQAVVDEGCFPTGCGISRNLYTVFPHPSALRADTFPQGKVLRVAANRTITTNLLNGRKEMGTKHLQF